MRGNNINHVKFLYENIYVVKLISCVFIIIIIIIIVIIKIISSPSALHSFPCGCGKYILLWVIYDFPVLMGFTFSREWGCISG